MVIEAETTVNTGEIGSIVPVIEAEATVVVKETQVEGAPPEGTDVGPVAPVAPLPSPQDDPMYRRVKAIMDMKIRRDAQRAKETKCCKSKNKPHDKDKKRAAKKSKKKNRH